MCNSTVNIANGSPLNIPSLYEFQRPRKVIDFKKKLLLRTREKKLNLTERQQPR